MNPACCSFCGAEYATSDAKCWDCKMALAEMPQPTLAADAPDDEVLYELDDWPVEARVKLTASLAERGIPARWEPGLTIAVLEADDEAAEQVALDPTLTDISRNHLEILVEGNSVLARDLASTNGTVLSRAGQAPRLIPTDEAIRLLPGDSLNLGGSATVEVEGIL